MSREQLVGFRSGAVGDPTGPVEDHTGPVGDHTGPVRDPTGSVGDPTRPVEVSHGLFQITKEWFKTVRAIGERTGWMDGMGWLSRLLRLLRAPDGANKYL